MGFSFSERTFAGSERTGSRLKSDTGEQVQAILDEAVEVAKAAAASGVSKPVTSLTAKPDLQRLDVDQAALKTEYAADDVLLRRSPDAAVPMDESSVEPLRGTPIRESAPQRAITPTQRGPQGGLPQQGPANGIR